MMTSNGNQKSQKKPRKSGVPTGNAGEYFVMGELLRRGFDAQLADRNTKKVQVKSVRSQPWYVKTTSYTVAFGDQLTIFVLLGDETARKPVRYFITRNHEVADHVHCPPNWKKNAFMPLNAIKQYENQWDIIFS
jgi:hypothetical protein